MLSLVALRRSLFTPLLRRSASGTHVASSTKGAGTTQRAAGGKIKNQKVEPAVLSLAQLSTKSRGNQEQFKKGFTADQSNRIPIPGGKPELAANNRGSTTVENKGDVQSATTLVPPLLPRTGHKESRHPAEPHGHVQATYERPANSALAEAEARLHEIRLLINAGQVQDATQLAKALVKDCAENLSPQNALYQFSRTGSIEVMVAYLKRMQELGTITGKEFTWLLLQTGQQPVRDKMAQDAELRNTVHDLLDVVSGKLLGITYTSALDIAKTTNSLESVETVQEQGVLVETVSDIRGDIISSSVYMDSTVTASIATYTGTKVRLADLHNEADPPEGQLTATMHPQMYVALYENGTRNLLPSHLNDGAITTRFLRSRLVDISSRSCRCPNCDRKLTPPSIAPQEKQRIRDKLRDVEVRHRTTTPSHPTSLTCCALSWYLRCLALRAVVARQGGVRLCHRRRQRGPVRRPHTIFLAQPGSSPDYCV
jgi:hypothetical protein